MQSDLPRAFLSACVRQELWKFILEFSGLFYCSIIKVQGLYPTSLLLTRCLRQRYISYHLCFSLSRTFLFYFLKFFQKIKSLETFKKISQLLTITFDKKISCFPALSPHRFVATAISILQHLFDIVKYFFQSFVSRLTTVQ